MTAKPTVSELGIDLAAQVWHRSGRGDGTIEVAFARVSPCGFQSGGLLGFHPVGPDARGRRS